MAKQESVIKFTGSLDGINFYMRKGKAVARKVGGGFTSKGVKNSPNMVRVRENSSEFGNCSGVKKEFRIALFPFLKHYKETTLHGRMMQLFQKIKELDTVSIRGQRNVGKGITSSEGKRIFKNFEFTPKCSVASVLGLNYTYDEHNCVFSVTDFNADVVKYGKTATHFELLFGVLGVNFETGVYTMHLSAPLTFAKDSTMTNFSLTPAELPADGMERFGFVGLTFYEEVNNILYVLKEDGFVGLMSV